MIERQHLRRPCAQRHAHADLLRPLHHGVRQHAIDADGREQRRDGAKTPSITA